MNCLEKKVDAILQFIAAENDHDRQLARKHIAGIVKEKKQNPFAGIDIQDRMDMLFLKLGIPDHLLGKTYLVDAINIVIDNPEPIKQFTRVLYPTVAKKNQTTPLCVERNIRNAIRVAWERGDLDTLELVFGNTPSPKKGVPTNSQFISRVAFFVGKQ